MTTVPATPNNSTSGAPPPLELVADRSRVTMMPGGRGQVAVTVRNARSVAVSLELTAEGPPRHWLALSPAALDLAPLQAGQAILTLSPAPDAPTGNYPVTLRAEARDDPGIRGRCDLVLEVGKSGELLIEVEPSQASGSFSGSFEVRVSHSSAAPLRVRLTARDEQDACDFTFEPPILLASPAQPAIARLAVQARQGLSTGSQAHEFTVFATTIEGPALVGTAHGRFLQRAEPPVILELKPARQVSADQATYTLRIDNPSQTEDTFRLTASDAASACLYQLTPPFITIPGGSHGEVTLTVTPRLTHQEPIEKTHTFTVRAEPSGQLLAPAQVTGQYVQTRSQPLRLVLMPTSQSAPKKAVYTLQVTNPRAVPVDVDLRVSDPGGLCAFTAEPSSLPVAPGATANSRLTARLTSRLHPGEEHRMIRFVVEARGSGLKAPSVVEGSLIQMPPRRRPFLLWLVLGLGLLALVIGAVWLFGRGFPPGRPTPTVVPIVAPPSPGATTAQPAATLTMTCIAILRERDELGALRVRSAPFLTAPVIARVSSDNEPVVPLGRTTSGDTYRESGEWIYGEVTGKRGWIHGYFIDCTSSKESIPIVPVPTPVVPAPTPSSTPP